ncbi:hypothetical protein PNOK_0801000 [Pyrrhoderma noxium]|uniref:Uncharacterized protein n=1 Tax=Pyrrhoderma noxium TaxID=2282107 RepID=A0A286U9Y9_9AGAM|nr:hypothetical protein PNOK_0801000 [Pyrrhoderma noxium]
MSSLSNITRRTNIQPDIENGSPHKKENTSPSNQNYPSESESSDSDNSNNSSETRVILNSSEKRGKLDQFDNPPFGTYIVKDKQEIGVCGGSSWITDNNSLFYIARSMNDPLGSINGADLNRDDHQVVINGIRSAKRPKRVDIIFYNPNKIIAYQPVIKYKAFVEDVEDSDIITTSKIIPDQIKYSASISSKEYQLVLRSDLASRIQFLPSSLAYESIIHGELQPDHNLVTRQTGLLPALSQRAYGCESTSSSYVSREFDKRVLRYLYQELS